MNRIAKGLNVKKQNTMTGDVLALLYDYIWGVTLFDVSLFNRIMKVINNKEDEVLTLFAYAGQMDLLVSVLSYRKSMGIYCEPDFGGEEMRALELAHPVLSDPVRNDFTLRDRAMITGVNASGKSTFMKSVAMAAIMSQSVLTISAKAFSLKPVSVYTCMSLRDDILTGESYYFREARYLKRLLDVVRERDDVLIVLDEMLKGTNTKERVAASKAILSYIVKHKCFCLVATHDNELTRDKAFMNYHFRSVVKNKDMTFTYKIYEGINTESNAISLLDLLGYPEEIVTEARRNVSA